MKRIARKKLGSITVLSLLALLAIAVVAQAALAAGSSSTPAAGTQGRGGVAAGDPAAFATTPAAGTQGRGGVAAFSSPATSSQAAAAVTGGSGLPIRARGGVPRPVSGSLAAPSSAATTSNFGAWLAVGLAGAALLVSIAAWVSYRRRSAREESSRAAFCALHPDDAACMSA